MHKDGDIDGKCKALFTLNVCICVNVSVCINFNIVSMVMQTLTQRMGKLETNNKEF